MARYAVRVIETLAKTIIIDGVDNFEEAIRVAETLDRVLDYDDFDDRNYEPSEYFNADDELGRVSDYEVTTYYEHLSYGNANVKEVADWIVDDEYNAWPYEYGFKEYQEVADHFHVSNLWVVDHVNEIKEFIIKREEVSSLEVCNDSFNLIFSRCVPLNRKKVDDNE